MPDPIVEPAARRRHPPRDVDTTAWLADRSALDRLGLRAWVDLLQQRGVADARRLARSPRPPDAELKLLLALGNDPPPRDLLNVRIARLARLPQRLRQALEHESFAVRTVDDLARMADLVDATTTLADTEDAFQEPPSAPRDLLPQAVGATFARASYSRFVREQPVALADMKLSIAVDEAKIESLDERLLAAFQFDLAPTLHLGYMASWRQRWTSRGTHLGEPLQSIGLAPGETRRIAVVDWQRRVASQRSEDTEVAEQLDNRVVHLRAVDEVTKATANELQKGDTSIEAGTLAASLAGVAGWAAVGGMAGATLGAPLAGVGAVPGALIGLGVGAVAGGIGVAATGAGNFQVGTVQSNTNGHRDVEASMGQRINDVSTQHANALRAVMSTVVLSASQAERENVSTRAIANHNHAHALTLQYFEVLQRYEVNTERDRHQALLFLPFKPIVFDAELVAAYWDILQNGFDPTLRGRFDKMVRLARGLTSDPLLDEDLELNAMRVKRLVLRSTLKVPLRIWLLSPRPELRELRSSGRFDSAAGRTIDLPAGGATLADVRGLRVEIRVRADEYKWEAVAVDAEVEFEHEPPIRLTVRDTSGRDGRIEWNLQALLEDERDELRARADAADDLTEVVAAVNGRRYFFTRLLILALEPEQLRELVEALLIVPAGGRGHALAMPAPRSLGVLHRGHLRDEIGKRFKKVPRKDGLPVAVLADSMPFGLCDGMLVLRQRTLVDQGATKEAFARFDARFQALVGLRDYPKQLNDDLSALGAGGSADEVFVPTGGHFLEAILGRSNSAERLDGRRHIFWHELPNPLVMSHVTARESVLLTATRGLTIPAQLEVEVAEAMHDDDGSNALVGDVVMARRRPVRITFEVRSAGMLLGSTPVDVGLTGGGTIVERGVLTGSGLSAGRVSVLYRPPAADGVAYVAAVVRTRSGRPAAGSAIVDHNA